MSLRINSDFNGVTDPDAGRYIAAVEAADGNQLLEFGVGKAINDFVVGCKQDRIWDAIKASCILAGARTLAGALVPLAGTAPTNNGPFVSGDYNRKTGLVGNGSSKYLNSNRANNADPQNNFHLSIYTTSTLIVPPSSYPAGGSSDDLGRSELELFGGTPSVNYRAYARGVVSTVTNAGYTGLLGAVRTSATSASMRYNTTTTVNTSSVSAAPGTTPISLFRRESAVGYLNAANRLAFYSIGESLDLALLDARVTALITAFGVAIP
jgi:hypothetical protein